MSGQHLSNPYLKARFSAKMSMVSSRMLTGNKAHPAPQRKIRRPTSCQCLPPGWLGDSSTEAEDARFRGKPLFVDAFCLLLLFGDCCPRNRRALCNWFRSSALGGRFMKPYPNAESISKRFPYSKAGQHFYMQAFGFRAKLEREYFPEF